MARFKIYFKMVDGSEKIYQGYESQNYVKVLDEVINSDGWFGMNGEFINLSNVIEFKIIETNEEGYEK